METKPITVRLPADLHARLKQAAEQSHRSLHGQILWTLESGISSDEDTK